MRKFTAMALAFLMAASLVMPMFAAEPTARIIHIHSIDGENVSLSRAQGREIEPRSGQRLGEGNVLATGFDTYVYLQLDADSIMKMDESSRLQVGSARERLTLSIQAGAALVDVALQPPGHSLETRVGNTAAAVRGTTYIMGRGTADTVFIIMLAGSAEVTVQGTDGQVVAVELPQGAMMIVYDVFADDAMEHEIIDQTYEIILQLQLEMMGLFEIQEIYNRRDDLLESGVITQEQHDRLPELIAIRQAERDAHREALMEALADLHDDLTMRRLPLGSVEQTSDQQESDDGYRYNGGGGYEVPPGDGSAANPFILTTPAHLEWMSDTAIYNAGYHFRMGADITVPTGLTIGGTIFGMQFDGQGHTLTVNLGQTVSSVFHILEEGSLIENVNITGNSIINDPSPNLFTAGSLARINHGTIRGVAVTSTVTFSGTLGSNFSFGGIAGHNGPDGLIENSSFTGSIYASAVIGGSIDVGGIAATNIGTINSSSFMGGTISGDQVGGIASLNGGTIQNVHASATVYATGWSA